MAIQTNADVAAKVRGVAAERRINQAQIAIVLALSNMAVSRRMGGQTPFSPAELSTLAAFMDVPVSRFFGELAEAVAS